MFRHQRCSVKLFYVYHDTPTQNTVEHSHWGRDRDRDRVVGGSR